MRTRVGENHRSKNLCLKKIIDIYATLSLQMFCLRLFSIFICFSPFQILTLEESLLQLRIQSHKFGAFTYTMAANTGDTNMVDEDAAELQFPKEFDPKDAQALLISGCSQKIFSCYKIVLN